MTPLVPALMYHDVIAERDWDASGFPGPAAAHYKLERGEFERQIERIVSMGLRTQLVGSQVATQPGFMLTFDDGGSSACGVGEWLAARGLHAHFFITTGRIGTRGFVTASDIRDLHAQGHVVGSHSHTHPANIARLPAPELAGQWRRSAETLADILATPTRVASIPGGFYSDAVAHAAAATGIGVLFTSEPTLRTWHVARCMLAGRFAIWRNTTLATVLGLASGRGMARSGQWLAWNAKKPLKRWLGPLYAGVRGRVLGDA
jgi:peptidoglycan/xylan/chitin deacetylase (PgdA/CDA1 family)